MSPAEYPAWNPDESFSKSHFMCKLMGSLDCIFFFKTTVSDRGMKYKSHITLTESVEPCSRDRDGQTAGGCHLPQTPPLLLLLLLILHKPQCRRPAGCPLFPSLAPPAVLAATPRYTNRCLFACVCVYVCLPFSVVRGAVSRACRPPFLPLFPRSGPVQVQ